MQYSRQWLLQSDKEDSNADGLELAAINRYYEFGEQFQFPTQHHKATADIANIFAVVTAEVCNGLGVRSESPGQPTEERGCARSFASIDRYAHQLFSAKHFELIPRSFFIV